MRTNRILSCYDQRNTPLSPSEVAGHRLTVKIELLKLYRMISMSTFEKWNEPNIAQKQRRLFCRLQRWVERWTPYLASDDLRAINCWWSDWVALLRQYGYPEMDTLESGWQQLWYHHSRMLNLFLDASKEE